MDGWEERGWAKDDVAMGEGRWAMSGGRLAKD